MKPSTVENREFRVVAAGVFKATCLQLMDEVYENKNLSIIVTKRSKPVGQLTALPEGLKITGPSIQLDNELIPSLQAEATATLEEHRKKKDKKKKHK